MRGAILLILGLLLGVAGGYMVAIVQEPELPERRPLDRPRARDGDETPKETEEVTRNVTPLRSSGPAPEEVERFVDQFEIPSKEPGEGQISGAVTNAQGEPLPGVLVRATPRGKRPGASGGRGSRDDIPDSTKLSEKVTRYVEQQLWIQAEQREARTDPEGKYVIAGLRDGPHVVRAWLENHTLRATPSSWNVNPGATIDFTAMPLVPVEIRVFDPFGQVIKKADLKFARRGPSRNVTTYKWTAEDPIIRVNEGTFAIQAEVKGEAEMRSSEEVVTLQTSEPPDLLRLNLVRINVVKGKVKLPKGDTRDSGLMVHLVRLRDGEEARPELLVNSKPHEWVHSYNGFAFRFGDVDSGRYMLGVCGNHGDTPLAHEVIQVSEGTVEQDIQLPPPEEGSHVVLTVLGPGGEMLRAVSFRELIRHDRSSRSGDGDATLRPDGRWIIRTEAPETRDESFRHDLTVVSETYGEKSIELDSAKASEMTVSFEAPAMLQLTVSGGSGHPDAARISVLVREKSSKRRHWHHRDKAVGLRRLDATGATKVGPLSPGDHVIELTYRGRKDWSDWTIATKEVRLTSGNNSATIDAPTLHELVVAMPEGSKGSRVNLNRIMKKGETGSHLSVQETVDDKGLARFGGLPAGRYRLKSWGKASGSMEITIPAAARVEWSPQSDDAIKVVIRDTAGSLASKGFQDGDLIVSVSGKSLGGRKNAVRLAMLQLYSGDTVACQVLRGGRTVALSVQFSESESERSNLGGRLTPTTAGQ